MDKEFKEKRMDLLFSVKKRGSKKSTRILFLLEHKSYQDEGLLRQILNYQTGIYDKTKEPVIPVVVYHGSKKWRGVLSFHEYLSDFSGVLKRYFGKNVLNFKCRLLNLQDLSKNGKKLKSLTSYPALYIMSHIWNLNEEVMRSLFVIGRRLSVRDRMRLIKKAVDYVRHYSPGFSWRILSEIEVRAIDKEEERVMPPLQISLDEERSKGLKQGRLEGLQKGRQEGLQKGLQKGQQELILKMLKAKADLSFISKVTGLSEQELKKLKNSSKK